jgi:membrane fusion protein, multidrug efflux system
MKKSSVLMLAVLLAACSDEEVRTQEIEHRSADVSVSEVMIAASDEAHMGTLEPEQVATVATRISGVVEAVLVHEGQLVRAGDVLVRLDATDVEAGVEAAQAQLALAERFHGRLNALAQEGAASQQELDEAVARLDVARARADGAVAQRAYVELAAPFDGVVRSRQADPGMLALPGQSLLVVQSRAASTVRLELPGRFWEHSSVGRTMRVLDVKTGWATDARVTRRAPSIGDDSRRFRLELTVDSVEGGPLPGTLVDVMVSGAGIETVWVPADAVVERGQLSGVFAAVGDTLRLRWIRIGTRDGARIEVLAGISAGDRVVREPGLDLYDGMPLARVTAAPWDPSVGRSDEEGGGR